LAELRVRLDVTIKWHSLDSIAWVFVATYDLVDMCEYWANLPLFRYGFALRCSISAASGNMPMFIVRIVFASGAGGSLFMDDADQTVRSTSIDRAHPRLAQFIASRFPDVATASKIHVLLHAAETGRLWAVKILVR
jgi:hypothetical protein